MESKFWNDFIEKVEDMLDRRKSDCVIFTDTIKIYRSQGAIEALELMLQYPDKLIKNK